MTNIKFKKAAKEMELERCIRGGFSTICNVLVCTKVLKQLNQDIKI